MKRFLYCTSAADDEQMVPADNIVGLDVQSSTSLFVYNAGISAINNNGIMKLTITDGKMDDVVKAIINSINYSKDAFIVLADAQNSEYLHPDITGVSTGVAS
tara:strand:- start:283 stop:588 length:306 start_codon:yes stop_codon:yes gene_type:complete